MLVIGLVRLVFVAVQVNSACRNDRSILRNLISFRTVPFLKTMNDLSKRRPDRDHVNRGGGIPEAEKRDM